MNIHFVLSHPAVPENIGFSLRALKVMGFGPMRLVAPCEGYIDGAKKTAYGSHDLLEGSLVFNTLQEATVDMDLVIGTTAKNRLSRHDYYAPGELADILRSKTGSVQNIALVFGSEQNGLSKEEIQQCDILSTIPLAAAYPSLNLAQSVLIYAYELASFKDSLIPLSDQSPQVSAQNELKAKAIEILQSLDLPRQPSLYHRIKDRIMSASADDTQLMLAFAKFLKQKLKE